MSFYVFSGREVIWVSLPSAGNPLIVRLRQDVEEVSAHFFVEDWGLAGATHLESQVKLLEECEDTIQFDCKGGGKKSSRGVSINNHRYFS